MNEAEVSILVVLDDWFGAVVSVTYPSFYLVSILVVLDDWFGARRENLAKGIFRFQSLLFWMIGSGKPRKDRSSVAVVVSILVVLDDWFGVGCHGFLVRVGVVSILVVLDDWFGDA